MRMCLFDRDNALKAVTLLHGGQHYALGSGGSLRLPILADIDTPDQQQWAAVWLENVLTGEGLPPTPRSAGNSGARCRCWPISPGRTGR